MKKFNKIFAALLAGALMTGCNDLDVEPVGSTVTQTQKEQVTAVDPGKALASVTGITGMLNAYMSVSDDHSAFGNASLFIQMDIRGMDMYSIYSGYNWFYSAMALSDGLPTSQFTYNMWAYNYNVILACNSVMSQIKAGLESESTEPEALNQLKYYASQALAFRAWCYLYLAQSYQFPYTQGHENDLSVPVVTEENSEEAAANGCARATLKEVYAQIKSDLTTAIEYMESTPITAENVIDSKPKRFASVATAYGLRARANLLTGDWTAAASDAQAAIAKFSGSPLTAATLRQGPGFNSIAASDWMWGIAVAETDRVVTSGIVNFPSHMGSFSYGYASAVGAWKWINKNLFAQIPANDVRRNWWLDENCDSEIIDDASWNWLLQHVESSLGDGETVEETAPGIQVKFAPYQGKLNNNVNASDIPLMRIEEMYYIDAEATGHTSLADGKTKLTDFVKAYRDPTFASAATTIDEFLDEIWLQRRIEFWGEGLSYYDMLRFGKNLDRLGSGCPTQVNYFIDYNDPKAASVLIYPIPRSEVQTNPLILDNENTLGGERPTPVIEDAEDE